MGSSVNHDPSVFAEALQISDDTLKTIFFVLIVGVVVVCLALLLALLLIRRVSRRDNEKFNYRSPPEYKP
jgi:nitrate reductase gamma subunit